MRKVAMIVMVWVTMASRPALADDRADIEKLVRAHLGGSAAPLAKDARVLVHGAPSAGAWQRELAGADKGAPVFAIDKLYVEVDPQPMFAVGWFHGAGKIDGLATRFHGVVSEESGWKIVAIAHARVVPDAELVARANKAATKLVPPAAPKLLGDKAGATCVAAWFGPKKLADGLPGTRTTGREIASGTSPAEHAERSYGDAASTSRKEPVYDLVRTWDALKLRPVEIEVTKVNQSWWVRAVVAMPIAGQKHAAPLVLTAVAAPGGMSCVWSSLLWADHTLAR